MPCSTSPVAPGYLHRRRGPPVVPTVLLPPRLAAVVVTAVFTVVVVVAVVAVAVVAVVAIAVVAVVAVVAAVAVVVVCRSRCLRERPARRAGPGRSGTHPGR